MLTSNAILFASFAINAVHVQGSTLPNNGHKVDVSKFRLQTNADYVPSSETPRKNGSSSFGATGIDYVKTATLFLQTTAPNSTFRLVGDHYIGVDGIGHVYFKQTVHSLDIDNADFNVNIAKNGSVFSYGSSFYNGALPSPGALMTAEAKSPSAALASVSEVLGLSITSGGANAESQDSGDFIIKGTKGAYQDPKARLVYFQTSDKLVLTWRIETDILSNWLVSYSNVANTKEILGVVDYTAGATYNVYPWGVNDPTEAERKVLSDPWTAAESPFTWQGDGSKTYSTTQGNNAIAQADWNGDGKYKNDYRPQSPNEKFEFPLDLSASNFKSYANASITQLFYTVNVYHDLLYDLGFTEAAGNFQANNAGKKGAAGDFVIVNAQDGAGMNNADFSTPPDGQNPRMRMYMWDQTTPQRDGVFEADIPLHENTHGLSNRLTGGPANSGCLNSNVAGGMGEGWSDFMATAIKVKVSHTRKTDSVMGAWVVNDPAGIRKYPYSTSMTTNSYTYADVKSLNEVHAIGTIWATMLYEMLWNLIDDHGVTAAIKPTFDANRVPTDGRYLAMQLVINGMALQPCSPNFVQARDAILDADMALTKGANACSIWKAFAKRGLGTKAKGGYRLTQSFDLPSNVCT